MCPALDFFSLFFKIWEQSHIHNERTQRWDPSLDIKFMYVAFAPYTETEVILYNVSNNWSSMVWIFPLEVSCQHCQVLEHFGFSG